MYPSTIDELNQSMQTVEIGKVGRPWFPKHPLRRLGATVSYPMTRSGAMQIKFRKIVKRLADQCLL